MTPGQNLPNAEKKRSKHTFASQLTSQQRAKLKGLAHSLKPVVQVGSGGISGNVPDEIKRALLTHELIKVQVPGHSDAAAKTDITNALTAALPDHSHIVDRIGRMVILYLEKNPDEEPKILLKAL